MDKLYATDLMNKIIQDAKERNVGRLLLHATDMGRPVYKKIGFEEVTKEMIYTIN
jgi:N-acetylglutamate synthase-like GNAT family acetyltransferase